MVTTLAISTSHDFCIWQRKHEGEKLVNCLSHHIVNRQFASLFDYKVSLSSAHSGCISITIELWVRNITHSTVKLWRPCFQDPGKPQLMHINVRVVTHLQMRRKWTKKRNHLFMLSLISPIPDLPCLSFKQPFQINSNDKVAKLE